MTLSLGPAFDRRAAFLPLAAPLLRLADVDAVVDDDGEPPVADAVPLLCDEEGETVCPPLVEPVAVTGVVAVIKLDDWVLENCCAFEELVTTITLLVGLATTAPALLVLAFCCAVALATTCATDVCCPGGN